MNETDPFETLKLELRRGAIVLAVLAQLRTEHYGYSLRKSLLERGLEIDEGTLYPLVRRLEQQGLLASEWREESKRQRRFYTITENGERVLRRLLDEWRLLATSVNAMTGETTR